MHTCKAENAVQNSVTRTKHVTGVLIPGRGHNEASRSHAGRAVTFYMRVLTGNSVYTILMHFVVEIKEN